MVKLKKSIAKAKLKSSKLRKVKTITKAQLIKSLSSVKEKTARRIIASPGASPIAKERARKILKL